MGKGKRRLVLVGFLLSGLFLNEASSAEKLKIGVGIRTAPVMYLPPMAADEKGFWKEQGLEAEWVGFASGRALGEAAVAGSVSVGLQTTPGLVTSVSLGLPMVIVADLEGGGGWYFFVKQDSPIKGAKDFKGAKMGVTRFGSMTDAYSRAVAKLLGLEKEVKIIATGGVPQAMAAIRTGVVNTILLTDETMAKLEFEGVVRKAVPLSDYFPSQWNGQSLFATKLFLEKNPDVVSKVVKGTVRAANFVNENPEWAIAKLKLHSGLPEAAAKKVFENIRYSSDGKIDRQVLQGLANFLIEYSLVSRDKAPRIDELYTGRFVPVR